MRQIIVEQKVIPSIETYWGIKLTKENVLDPPIIRCILRTPYVGKAIFIKILFHFGFVVTKYNGIVPLENLKPHQTLETT